MKIEDSDKIRSIISLYNHTYDETRRYRDHVWKILIWTIGLILAIHGASEITPTLVGSCLGKCLGTVFILTVSVFGWWNIHFDYKQLVRNRNILRKCERILKFFDRDIYGEELLQSDWKNNNYKFSQCLPHYMQWIFIIIVVAIYSIYALFLK